MKEKVKVISLFTGCGGLDLGFEGGFDIPKACINNMEFVKFEKNKNFTLKKNCFEVVFCNDIMKEAKNAYQSNFKNDAKYCIKSVSDLSKSELPKAELVIGGFPCQDFSLAGKREGFASSRGMLYKEMARIVREVSPKAFVAENVYGLLSIDGAVETIKQEFSNCGYRVFHYPVEAQNYGVPQTRKRIFFVGVKETALTREVKKEDFLPNPTHAKEWVALKDVFGTLLEPDKTEDPDQKSYSKAKFYGSNCQGNRAVDMSKPAPTMRAEHHGNIEFRRLENGGNNDDRRLTVREVSLIQTFPSSFYFTEKNGKKLLSQSFSYKVLGNAVPPLLAYHFARNLDRLWPSIFKL